MQRVLTPILRRLLRRYVASASGGGKSGTSRANSSSSSSSSTTGGKSGSNEWSDVDLWQGRILLENATLNTAEIEEPLLALLPDWLVEGEGGAKSGAKSGTKGGTKSGADISSSGRLRVARVFCKSLELNVPWTNLYNEPVVAHATGVEVSMVRVSVTNRGTGTDSRGEEQKGHMQRGSAASGTQHGHDVSGSESDTGGSQDTSGLAGYFVDVEALKRNIAANLALHVRDLVVRYEGDDVVAPCDKPDGPATGAAGAFRTGCAAIVIKELTVQSADPESFETHKTVQYAYESSDEEAGAAPPLLPGTPTTDPGKKLRMPVFIDPGTTNSLCKKITLEGLEVRLGARAKMHPPSGNAAQSWYDGLDELLLMKPVHVDGRLRTSNVVGEVGSRLLSRIDFRLGDIDISCSQHQWDALQYFFEWVQTRLAEQDGDSALVEKAGTLRAASSDSAGPQPRLPVLPAGQVGSQVRQVVTPSPPKQPESGGSWLGWMWDALTEDEPPQARTRVERSPQGLSDRPLFEDENGPRHTHLGVFVPSMRVRLLEMGGPHPFARGSGTEQRPVVVPLLLELGQSAFDVCQRFDPDLRPQSSSGLTFTVHTRTRFQWQHEGASGKPNAPSNNPWSDIPGFLFAATGSSKKEVRGSDDGDVTEESYDKLRRRAARLETENDELKLSHTKALSEVEQLRHAMVATGNEELCDAAESSRLRQRVFDLQLKLERAQEKIRGLSAANRKSASTENAASGSAPALETPTRQAHPEDGYSRITRF